MYMEVAKLFMKIGVTSYPVMLGFLIPIVVCFVIVAFLSKNGLVKCMFSLLSVASFIALLSVAAHIGGFNF